MELCEYTIHELHEKLIKREISSEELTKSVLKRIDDVEADVKAYVTVDEKGALAASRRADEMIASAVAEGREGSLSAIVGIPMGIKDNICVEGTRTTCCSKMLEDFVPPYDATVTKIIKDDGGVILGKLNMDEFAMGSSTETSKVHTTSNPWDLNKVPGGSSGGSAASVAIDEAIWSIGTDTGGSIRQPAALCGVVGMKPTYGQISRYGVVAFASSFDQVGPFTKDVTDCALVMNSLARHDALDSTSYPNSGGDFSQLLGRDIRGMKIGIPKEYFGSELDKDVKRLVLEAVEKLEDLGAEAVDVSLPNSEYTMQVYHVLASGEVSSNLARFDGIRYGISPKEAGSDINDYIKNARGDGFGLEVKRRIIMGTYFLSSGLYDQYYNKVMRVRTLICRDMEKALQSCDCIISPTTCSTAFVKGEKIADVISMYKSDTYTTIANITGNPAVSIPCGFVDEMPVGIQFTGRHFDEKTILQVSYALEKELGLKSVRPALLERK